MRTPDVLSSADRTPEEIPNRREAGKNQLCSAAGFTFVELILVIAILAILAGVGAVTYSGYIRKANEAADRQLLGAVNTAFAAACLENGTDIRSVEHVTLTMAADKTVASVDLYEDSFAKFYAGNEGTAFKVFEALVFDDEQHAFIRADPNDVAAGSDGLFSAEDVQRLGKSIFITAESLGVQGLMAQADQAVTLAEYLFSMGLSAGSSDFQLFAAKAMGISTEGKTQAEISQELDAKQQELAAQMMAQDSKLTSAAAVQKVQENAAVLYAVNQAAQMQQDEICSLLSAPGASAKIFNDMGVDLETALSGAVLAYGMYTAYAYSAGDSDTIDKAGNFLDALNGLEEAGFRTYMQSDQADTDLAGYLAALTMIDSGAGDPDVVSGILINGFEDPSLTAILQKAVDGG